MAVLNKLFKFPDGALKNPDSMDKINYIKNFMLDVCDAPFSLYVETLWPALLEGVITYYDIDPVQIFTAWARPPGTYKDKRRGKHGRGEKKKKSYRTYRRYWKSFSGFDPSNKIGKWLPDRGYFLPYSNTPGVNHLWRLYDVEQRAMYWVMVYEIVQEVFYKWASGVARSEYCKYQYTPICMCESGDDANIPLQDPSPINIENVLKARHTVWAAGNGIEVWGWGSAAFFSAKIVSFGEAPPGTPGCRLLLTHDDGTHEVSPDFNQVGDVVAVSASTRRPGMWRFWTQGPSYFMLQELSMTVIGREQSITDV